MPRSRTGHTTMSAGPASTAFRKKSPPARVSTKGSGSLKARSREDERILRLPEPRGGLVALRQHRLPDGPHDADRGIVPAHAAVERRIELGGDLVREVRALGQHDVAVRAAGRDPEQLSHVAGEPPTHP